MSPNRVSYFAAHGNENEALLNRITRHQYGYQRVFWHFVGTTQTRSLVQLGSGREGETRNIYKYGWWVGLRKTRTDRREFLERPRPLRCCFAASSARFRGENRGRGRRVVERVVAAPAEWLWSGDSRVQIGGGIPTRTVKRVGYSGTTWLISVAFSLDFTAYWIPIGRSHFHSILPMNERICTVACYKYCITWSNVLDLNRTNGRERRS